MAVKYSRVPTDERDADEESAIDFSSAFKFESFLPDDKIPLDQKYKSIHKFNRSLDEQRTFDVDAVAPRGLLYTVFASAITVACYLIVILTMPISMWFCIKSIKHHERFVVFRLGLLIGSKGPGMTLLLPCIDKWKKVDIRTKAFSIPPLTIMTSDGGGVEIGAEVYHRVTRPILSVTSVCDLNHSTRQLANTVLQNLLIKKTIQEIENERPIISQFVINELNKTTETWGYEISRLELSQVKVLIPAKESSSEALSALKSVLMPPSGAGDQPSLISSMMPALMNPYKNTAKPDLNSESGDGLMETARAKYRILPTDILLTVQTLLCPSLVNEFNTIIEFNVTGENGGLFFLDLKNGNGAAGAGRYPGNDSVDIILSLDADSMSHFFTGSLSAFNLYMSGNLKVEGDLNAAMQLGSLIERVKQKLPQAPN